MKEFVCSVCKKRFTSQNGLTYHSKKNVCDRMGRYDCEYCGKLLSSSYSLYRHKTNSCKNRPSHDVDVDDDVDDTYDLDKDEILKKFSEMEERIKKLESENQQLKMKDSGVINNGAIHYGSGNMNIMVNVVPFGQENISKIDKTELLKVFRSGFNSALQLTETTHFNPKYPEFHNVYISSMKNKYAMTYDGSEWALVTKDDLIDKLYGKKRDYIEENMEDFLESLTSSQINALHRWLNVDDDHQHVQKIKNDMKLMLYNKRKMVLNSKNQQVDNDDTTKKLINSSETLKQDGTEKQKNKRPITRSVNKQIQKRKIGTTQED